jgi:hypothetical protein
VQCAFGVDCVRARARSIAAPWSGLPGGEGSSDRAASPPRAVPLHRQTLSGDNAALRMSTNVRALGVHQEATDVATYGDIDLPAPVMRQLQHPGKEQSRRVAIGDCGHVPLLGDDL